MGKCKNCRFWEMPQNNKVGEVPGVGRCTAVVQFWDATQWDEDYENRQLKSEYAGKLAFVQDESDCHAELKTMPEFGCVQFVRLD